MQSIGPLLKQRLDHIVFENQMLRAGFAAVPYMVIRDNTLSIGARFTYSVLLMYGWQEGSSFAGQEKMAGDMATSERQLQRYLYELRDAGYIRIERQDRRFNNTYVILDRVLSKLKAKRKTSKSERDTTPVSSRTRHPRRVGHDTHVVS